MDTSMILWYLVEGGGVMDRKARFAVIIKILGAFMVLTMIIGFFIIDDAEAIDYLFMGSLFCGGVFNLLDFGKTAFSIIAFVFYCMAACLSASIGLSEGILSYDFMISFFALLINFARCISVLKKSGKYNANIFTNATQTSPGRQQTESNGCLTGIIGLILLFVGLYILGVRLKLFVFIAPVR